MNLSHRPEDKTDVYGKETMQDSKLRSCCERRHRLWLPPWQSPATWVCAEDCSTLLKELSCKRYYYCCYYYIWISGSNIVQWGSSTLQWEHSLITQSHLFPVVWEREHIRSTSGRPSSSASTKTSIQAEFKPPDAVLFIGHFIAPLRFFSVYSLSLSVLDVFSPNRVKESPGNMCSQHAPRRTTDRLLLAAGFDVLARRLNLFRRKWVWKTQLVRSFKQSESWRLPAGLFRNKWK